MAKKFFALILSLMLLVTLLVTATGCADQETETAYDRIPMVRIDNTLYLDTGHDASAPNKEPDGTITSEVSGSEEPKENDQSNFGTGFSYCFGDDEGTMLIDMNGAWRLFATEEARKAIQFPEKEEE